MIVHVLAFARVRELLGFADRAIELRDGATAGEAWEALCGSAELRSLTESTRLARNGAIVEAGATLYDGDELALLPPVGGG
jgi:molybdopterin converting factor small subunit